MASDWIGKILGAGAGTVIDSLGTAIDKVHTSEEETAAAKQALEKLRQIPGLAQIKVNEVEAQHRSIFVAGWRPSIGWVCSLGLAFAFIGIPIMGWYILIADVRLADGSMMPTPEMPHLEYIMELVLALLGMGILRTMEKARGLSK